MRSVTLRNRRLWVGRRAIPLLAGEVHYWRLSPDAWSDALDAARSIGVRIVSTYVCWDYHEVRRGVFDFRGRTSPQRNLVRFLELARKKGFWVFIRPGPYIYSEWPREGVPAYAHAYHRLHPQFLKSAETYLRAVMSVLRPYQAVHPRGHVVLLQADNEIDCQPDVFGHQLGLGKRPGLFQSFLREKYAGSIDDLNVAWGTSLARFEDARPFARTMGTAAEGVTVSFPLEGDREFVRNLDYFAFKHGYAKQYASWVVAAYRKLGARVPVVLNLYPFFYAQDWQAMQETCDLAGVDLYPAHEFREDPFDHRKFLDKIRFLRTVAPLAFLPEFAAGTWHEQHYRSGVLFPNHYRLAALSALAAGAHGWNWYMLVNRDNWYMSPVNEWGRAHGELARVFQDTAKIFLKLDPPRLARLTEVGVVGDAMHRAARAMRQEGSAAQALYEADVDYEIFNPATGRLAKRILFYNGNQWLARRSQERLLAYVRSGGILVAFRDFPRKDERLRPCQIVGFSEPASHLFEFRRSFEVPLGRGLTAPASGSVYVFRNPPGRPVRARFPGCGPVTIGYERRVGKGRLLHLGVEAGAPLACAVLGHYGIPVYAQALGRHVKTALLRGGGRRYLIALNLGETATTAAVRLPVLAHSKKRYRLRDLASGKITPVPRAGEAPVCFELGAKDGAAFEIY